MKYLRTQCCCFVLWYLAHGDKRYYPHIVDLYFCFTVAGAAEGNGYYFLQDWGRLSAFPYCW